MPGMSDFNRLLNQAIFETPLIVFEGLFSYLIHIIDPEYYAALTEMRLNIKCIS